MIWSIPDRTFDDVLIMSLTDMDDVLQELEILKSLSTFLTPFSHCYQIFKDMWQSC